MTVPPVREDRGHRHEAIYTEAGSAAFATATGAAGATGAPFSSDGLSCAGVSCFPSRSASQAIPSETTTNTPM